MSESCAIVRLVPGPQGTAGADGTDGVDGISAFTTLTAQFTVPAELVAAAATVADTSWMTVGNVYYLQGAGWFEVTTIGGATSVTLKNLENTASGAYSSNVAPGTVIAVGNKLVAAGIQGSAGTAAGGVLLAANDLNDVDNPANARNNLALGTLATLNSVNDSNWSGADLGVANGGTGASTAAGARTNLGLVIGTDVQAFHALLAAIAGIAPSAADQLIYSTGVNTLAFASLTSFGRSILAGASAAAVRTTLGVLPGYGLLAELTGWDLNSATTDTAMTVSASRYIIDKITVENASVNMTTATGGVFTAAGGGGTTIAADQALSALTASTKFDDLTLQAIAGTDVFTAGTLYARCGTAQGGAATASIRLYGWKIS